MTSFPNTSVLWPRGSVPNLCRTIRGQYRSGALSIAKLDQPFYYRDRRQGTHEDWKAGSKVGNTELEQRGGEGIRRLKAKGSCWKHNVLLTLSSKGTF